MSSPFRQSVDAILLACGGWFLFCICDAIAKWLSGDGYPVLSLLALNAVNATVLTGGWILFRHGINGFRTPRWRWYIARSMAQSASLFFVVKSLSMIHLADFYGIIFLTPMMATLLAIIFLKERIGIYRSSAIAFGFIGVLIITGPSFNDGNTGYLYALGAMICAATGAILVRKIGRETVPMRYAFFPSLCGSLIFLPLAMIDGLAMPSTGLDMGLLALFAPLSILGLLGYSSGFARARDTAVVAPFHYTQMIWGILFGFLIFHETPEMTTYAGAGIIILAGLIVLWRERVLNLRIAADAQKTPI